ncbi:MAG: NAD(P)-binding protein [Lachnospiraceae bacterium]|nr:NAD(P)-binding protein [Lachnospiraceae bacterium]
MELAEYSVFSDRCFRDTPPPCAAVCPLAYDVREFIRLMQKGSVRSAYKIIRNSLIFPSVITKICPGTCQNACVRGRIGDGSVDLRSLEQICVDKMAGKDPERYNIPRKQNRAAVIGAGLSGLACAYRLASFGYPVTVYERDSLIGGRFEDGIDRQWVHDEITREFKAVKCDFSMETEIGSLADISAEAVYIATGKDGVPFRDEASGAFSGILLRGGALTGADTMESVRMGLSAAEAINNRLLTSREAGREELEIAVPERSADRRYYDLSYDLGVPEEIPEKGAAEAFRCMRCNCSACYDVCPLMEKHRQYPKKITSEIIVTLKPNKSKRTAVRMLMGCTECGACREACPEKIDMGKCLQEARSDFYESGAMSPAFHDYWLQDMAFCESEEARILQIGDESRPADVLFFPGCQLSASLPEYTAAAYGALKKACDNPAMLLACCGVPAKWAGHRQEYEEIRKQITADWERAGRPTVVTACPSCLESMKTLHPDMKILSYYRFMEQHPEMSGGKNLSGSGKAAGSVKVKVIDPCSGVSEPEMASSVRKLLSDAGYDIINPEPDPACCGFGGHIYNAVPALHDTFAARRTEDIADTDVIAATYCANCRDILAYRGADARHVLGMLLGISEERRRPPELGIRRENRRIAKKDLAGENALGTEEAQVKKTGKQGGTMEIRIPEKLIDKMDRELILREQAEEIIRDAESTGVKLFDDGDNLYIAHKRFGTVTIWVVYSVDQTVSEAADPSEKADPEGVITVENVYCHRMEIREDP